MPNLVYSEIRVRNLVRSVRFYRELGLIPKSRGKMDDGTSFVWIWDRRTKQLVELWHAPRSSQFHEPFRTGKMFDPRLMISTSDVKPILRKVRLLGGRVTQDERLGDVRLTIINDPDGHDIEILSWTAPDKHPTDKVPLLNLVLSPTGHPD